MDGSSWVQKGSVIEGKVASEYAGYSVDLNSSGSILVVITASDNGIPSKASVYEWNGSDWSQKGTDIPAIDSISDIWTSVLSEDGSTLVIGMPEADGAYTQAGQVVAYEWDGTQWQQKGSFISGMDPSGHSGEALDISSSGDTIIIGSPDSYTLNNRGLAKVFVWLGGQWWLIGDYLTNANPTADYGNDVAISKNGKRILVGSVAYASALELVETIGVRTSTLNRVEISPNPTTGRLLISSIPIVDELSIHVLDITGRVMQNIEVSGKEDVELDLSGIPTGMYQIVISSNHQTISAESIIVSR